MPIVHARVRGPRGRRRDADGAVDDDTSTAPPSIDALGDEVSLEQCERLFACVHFDACRAMCETVYRAYAVNPNAPRPLRAASARADEKAAAEATEEAEMDDATRELEDVKAAARRARRPERYPEEVLALASSSDDGDDDDGLTEDERRRLAATKWPVEDLYSRDAPWVASCLWTQCKFKSSEGLAKTFDADVELLCEGVPREMRSIGPQMRMLWCKLKWEEGEAKRAGTPEEREVERVTLALFDEAVATAALDPEKNPDEDARELWSEALGNLAWLYASQILAKQRGDETRARLWLEERASMLDPTAVSAIKSWITDARSNRTHRFEITHDEVTDRIVIKRNSWTASRRTKRPPTPSPRRRTRTRKRPRRERARTSRRATTTHRHRRRIRGTWTPRSTSLERFPETPSATSRSERTPSPRFPPTPPTPSRSARARG